MGWYFRRSASLGPFRVNFSKSGIGYSFGVRGARISVGPRGTYLRGGRGGVYFQQKLDSQASRPTEPTTPPAVVNSELSDVIQTADAEALQDSSAQDLLEQIRVHHAKIRWSPIVAWATLIAIIACLVSGASVPIPIGLAILGALLHVLSQKRDQREKELQIDYQLDGDRAKHYVAFLESLEILGNSSNLWRVTSQETNIDTKYTAGATTSVKRNSISCSFEGPKFINASVAVWQLNLGSHQLYFFPDRVLVYQGNAVGAVNYIDLALEVRPVQFVEEGTVPSDSVIVDQTWRFTNKNGGPDRRFSNNRQIPVVRYAQIRLRSSAGMNFALQGSDPTKAEAFVMGVKGYAASIQP